MNGTLKWVGLAHKVPTCDAVASGNATQGETTNVYSFNQKECVKTAGYGVSRQIELSRKDRHEAASNLTVGDWVLFAVESDEADDEDDAKFWLGRVMPNPACGGQGVQRNTARKIQKYDKGLKIRLNEVALNIMWYEAISVGSDTPEY